jgi:hypothetical protein
MASQKQIAANRANAQKSTGPRTPEGKAASRCNALKTGVAAKLEIIPTEDPAALEALAAEFHDHYRPATPEERSLVDTIVRNEWLLRRMAVVEASFWEGTARRAREGTGDPGRELLGRDFSRLQWRLNSIQRNLYAAADRLRALQTARRSAPQSADPDPLTSGLASFETPSPESCPVPAMAPFIIKSAPEEYCPHAISS